MKRGIPLNAIYWSRNFLPVFIPAVKWSNLPKYQWKGTLICWNMGSIVFKSTFVFPYPFFCNSHPKPNGRKVFFLKLSFFFFRKNFRKMRHRKGRETPAKSIVAAADASAHAPLPVSEQEPTLRQPDRGWPGAWRVGAAPPKISCGSKPSKSIDNYTNNNQRANQSDR